MYTTAPDPLLESMNRLWAKGALRKWVIFTAAAIPYMVDPDATLTQQHFDTITPTIP